MSMSGVWNVTAGLFSAGLLASGIIPVVRHCLENLLTANAHVIPASATVFAQVAASLLLLSVPTWPVPLSFFLRSLVS